MISAKLKNNGGMGHELTERVGGGINYIGSFCHTFPGISARPETYGICPASATRLCIRPSSRT